MPVEVAEDREGGVLTTPRVDPGLETQHLRPKRGTGPAAIASMSCLAAAPGPQVDGREPQIPPALRHRDVGPAALEGIPPRRALRDPRSPVFDAAADGEPHRQMPEKRRVIDRGSRRGTRPHDAAR